MGVTAGRVPAEPFGNPEEFDAAEGSGIPSGPELGEGAAGPYTAASDPFGLLDIPPFLRRAKGEAA